MQNGKVNNLEQNYSKKKIHYLLLSWGSLLLSGGIIGILYYFQVQEPIIFAVLFILFIFEMFLLLSFKSRISYYDLRHRYQLLLNSSAGLTKTTCMFDNKWMESLQKEGFLNYINNADFAIYYRIGKSITNRSLIKRGLLEIVTVVRNPELDFYGDVIEEQYKNIWTKYEKQHRLNKQVIIQFRKYDEFNESIQEELNQIICYRLGDNHLVQINCGYFPESKNLYYLHSDKYYPSIYYKKAIETIQIITKL